MICHLKFIKTNLRILTLVGVLFSQLAQSDELIPLGEDPNDPLLIALEALIDDPHYQGNDELRFLIQAIGAEERIMLAEQGGQSPRESDLRIMDEYERYRRTKIVPILETELPTEHANEEGKARTINLSDREVELVLDNICPKKKMGIQALLDGNESDHEKGLRLVFDAAVQLGIIRSER